MRLLIEREFKKCSRLYVCSTANASVEVYCCRGSALAVGPAQQRLRMPGCVWACQAVAASAASMPHVNIAKATLLGSAWPLDPCPQPPNAPVSTHSQSNPACARMKSPMGKATRLSSDYPSSPTSSHLTLNCKAPCWGVLAPAVSA